MVVAEALETRAISQLPEIIEDLDPGRRALFEAHYSIETGVAEVIAPPGGNLNGLELQPVVQVYNRWTHEKASFNARRAERFQPISQEKRNQLDADVEATRGKDRFCKYREEATRDVVLEDGLMEGEHTVLVGSMFKSAPVHAIAIHREHNPMHTPSLDEFLERHEMTERYFRHGYEWGLRQGKRYTNPTFIENRFANAGSSVWDHAHSQLTLSPGTHEGRIQQLISVANFYYHLTEGRDYFEDEFEIHQSLGLGFELPGGIRGTLRLTPRKEREVMLIIPNFDLAAREALHRVYTAWTEKVRVIAFNLGIGLRPLEDNGAYPADFPDAVVSLIDRGDPTNKTADMGGLEMTMGTSVVASNPWRENLIFREALGV